MSKKVTSEKYKKTLSHKLETWFYGTEDPYVNRVEMKPQQEVVECEEVIKQREEEKKNLLPKQTARSYASAKSSAL